MSCQTAGRGTNHLTSPPVSRSGVTPIILGDDGGATRHGELVKDRYNRRGVVWLVREGSAQRSALTKPCSGHGGFPLPTRGVVLHPRLAESSRMARPGVPASTVSF